MGSEETSGNAWRGARAIIRVLKEHGHEAYLVGGCVRDHLLGQDPETLPELDVVTSAVPDEVERLFRRTVPVGKAFGVVRVAAKGAWTEVATFRTESDYRDGRHPSNVAFATAREDVIRRDFTVNGLLWDPDTGEVIDHVGGTADLERRVIRAIGDPDARFAEDHLRLLRAVRFGSSGDFQLEAGTAAAITRHAAAIRTVSAERVREEILKIAGRPQSRRGDAWRALVATGLAAHILPEALRTDTDDAVRVLDRLALRTLPLFLAAVLRGTVPAGRPPRAGLDLAEEIGRRLRCAEDESARLGALLADRGRYRGLAARSRARQRLAATRPGFAEHEDLLRAEGDAAGVLALLEADRAARGAERERPLLDGRVLMAAGVKPGKRLGFLLRKARVLQLSGEVSSAADALRRLGVAP